MALQIKDRATEELARSVAGATGEEVTRAIHNALQERLDRLQPRQVRYAGEKLVDRILEISQQCSSLPDLDDRSADEILGYDEHGTFG